jgi:DNA mismatch repair protein MutS
MAGFPYHALDGYLQKLIRAGCKAAVCEQVEDPKLAKGLVRREVTRIVTPGTLTDDALLDPRTSNYVAAVSLLRDAIGLAWLELSTGRFLCSELSVESRTTGHRPHPAPPTTAVPFGSVTALLLDELGRIRPAECVAPELDERDSLLVALRGIPGLTLTKRPAWSFSLSRESRRCRRIFAWPRSTASIWMRNRRASRPPARCWNTEWRHRRHRWRTSRRLSRIAVDHRC